MRKTENAQQPWWLSPEQECSHCSFDYPILAEVYCADCDRPVCPMCVVVIHHSAARHICPDCHTEKHN